MKKIKIKKNRNMSTGLTLIEVIIFTILLSMLMANMINYLYTIHTNNIKLMNEIQDAQKGFIATTAVILLAMGTLAFLLATMSAASFYGYSIETREMRIQKQLNWQACQETLPLIIAKDYFFESEIMLSNFDCTVHK